MEEKKTAHSTILFISDKRDRVARRKIEKEYNKTIRIYRGIEERFGEELFSIKEEYRGDNYDRLYSKYNKLFKNTCISNIRMKRHLYTKPNPLYFESKYKPKEGEVKKKGFVGGILSYINKVAGNVRFIER